MKKRWCSTLWPTEALAAQAGMGLEDFAAFVRGALFLDQPDPVSGLGRPARLPGAADRPPARRARAAPGGRGDRPHAQRRRAHLGQLRRQAQHAQRRGLHRPARAAAPTAACASRSARRRPGSTSTASSSSCATARSSPRAPRVGDEYLQRALATDDGARFLGEIGIGTNFGIARPTGTILFDEKIGGTVHLALGRSYPETGGKNQLGAALGPHLRPARRRAAERRRRGRAGGRALQPCRATRFAPFVVVARVRSTLSSRCRRADRLIPRAATLRALDSASHRRSSRAQDALGARRRGGKRRGHVGVGLGGGLELLGRRAAGQPLGTPVSGQRRPGDVQGGERRRRTSRRCRSRCRPTSCRRARRSTAPPASPPSRPPAPRARSRACRSACPPGSAPIPDDDHPGARHGQRRHHAGAGRAAAAAAQPTAGRQALERDRLRPAAPTASPTLTRLLARARPDRRRPGAAGRPGGDAGGHRDRRRHARSLAADLAAAARPRSNQIPLATLQPLLDALPRDGDPRDARADQGHARLADRPNGTLTQKGLQIFVALGGQTVADLTLGQASVSQGDVGCAQPVAAAQLACTDAASSPSSTCSSARATRASTARPTAATSASA